MALLITKERAERDMPTGRSVAVRVECLEAVKCPRDDLDNPPVPGVTVDDGDGRIDIEDEAKSAVEAGAATP